MAAGHVTEREDRGEQAKAERERHDEDARRDAGVVALKFATAA